MKTGETFGRYELRRRIARGDVTEVFLAREPEGEGVSGLTIVRRVLPERAGNREFVERFLEEARLAARLEHPNIVQVTDAGELDGSYFIATEYVPGGSLLELVRRLGGPLSVDDALFVVGEVCAGLQLAHSLAGPDGTTLGAVHGDLGPKNVVVSVDGVVKVVDFGLAKAWARFGAGPPTERPGASAHLAPEVARGGAVDRRADVYSCGALLYHLLTGGPAFPEATDPSRVPALAGRLRPPRDLRPELPEEVEAIVLVAMAPEPRDRFATCGAMRRRIGAAVDTLWLQGSAESIAALARSAFPEVLSTADARESMPGEAPPPPSSPAAVAQTTGTAPPATVVVEPAPPPVPATLAVAPTPHPASPADPSAPRRRRGGGLLLLGLLAVLAVLLLAGGGLALWLLGPWAGAGQGSSPGAAEHARTLDPAIGQGAGTAPSMPQQPHSPPRGAPESEPEKPDELAVAGLDAGPTKTSPLDGSEAAEGDEMRQRPVASGYVSVLTVPSSKVYLGGKLLGTTPLLKHRVPAGRHSLRLVAAGVPEKRVPVTVHRNELTQVRQSLWPSNAPRPAP